MQGRGYEKDLIYKTALFYNKYKKKLITIKIEKQKN